MPSATPRGSRRRTFRRTRNATRPVQGFGHAPADRTTAGTTPPRRANAAACSTGREGILTGDRTIPAGRVRRHESPPTRLPGWSLRRAEPTSSGHTPAAPECAFRAGSVLVVRSGATGTTRTELFLLVLPPIDPECARRAVDLDHFFMIGVGSPDTTGRGPSVLAPALRRSRTAPGIVGGGVMGDCPADNLPHIPRDVTGQTSSGAAPTPHGIRRPPAVTYPLPACSHWDR